jgi:RsiW-degrading membrane proteinase PrsW (M82 family)
VRAWCALQAYVVAGLFEESVKYLAVRRIVFKNYVVDPRAMVVYSCCAGRGRSLRGGLAVELLWQGCALSNVLATPPPLSRWPGAAFGTIEDVMYNLSYGVATAVVRAFTSVPLHMATGLIIGLALAERRFFERDTERWYKTLILPILIHGTYDFATFVLSQGYLAVVGFAIGVLIVVGSYLYIRRGIVRILKAFPVEVDAHQKIISGEIEPPGCLCCNPRSCPSCYF